MGISSLGAGGGVLTQDLLDQLKEADQAQYINPLDTRKATETKKQDAFNVINAYMDNVDASLKTLTQYGVFESRTASSSNEDVATVSAADSSDVQDFSLEVLWLAKKEIVQSGTFATKTSTVATGSGKFDLQVGGETFRIDYNAATTLEDLKNSINKEAGDSVSATIVQIADNDFRLFLSAKESGLNQDITITDVAGEGEALNAALTTGVTNVQEGIDASFKYNSQTITRSSNDVKDLLSGVTITLKEVGVANISVGQNKDNIASKIENFISKYNSALYQLTTDTKSSENAEERGIFSNESIMKTMKADLLNMINNAGESVGRAQDYGIKIAEDGSLSLDKTKLNEMLDENADNVKAFFTGGTFVKSDGSEAEIEGAFTQMLEKVQEYTKYNANLDQYKTLLEDKIESLTEQRTKALERLTTKYEIMAKQFAAYDAVITQLNSVSSMFTDLVNAQSADN
ncbi:MAG: flagellar filament capping protein FliD [Sulfurimonas sp.]|uniref:flagellar filament capping protein FliD n=1 Tax=Sulfurimonas sp. TaxID=2022749 RepID=UPI0026279447|nr:flagellar filament capping protein FliD [Sulfurimonas sp.]MDD2652043.1 flagellar filament capping protein FliD [Sulfurimonas sp.]MDD3452048.1 flagellar filament capping protein FliD [Sulfurimonas sp.]